MNRLLLTCLTLAGVTACSSASTSSETANALLLDAAIEACAASADAEARHCERDCERLTDEVARATCTDACTLVRNERASSCDAVDDVGILECDEPASCLADLERCRNDAAEAGATCEAECGADSLALRCQLDCEARRAADEASCAFVAARTTAPATEIPVLPMGRPADLSLLLDDEEIAVVEAADVRAEALRKRDLRLFVGRPDVAVTITQLSHGFEFGFPVDFREFRDEPEDLEFYGRIARDHASLMVAETGLKWRQLEPEPGRLEFDLGDSELAWADQNGFKVKMHTLLWGNAPPLSTGSGTPDWLRARFPDNVLSESEQQELRDLIRFQAESIVERYRGRIDIYDITNEMLNPITGWFSERLGQSITDDLFRWVRAIDPGAQLVMNEWISEVFTDFGGADAESVRDRVFELQAAGVPIDAIGIQAHFAPVTVFVGEPTLDDPRLERRTRIDDYAEALAVLSEPGLPLHMTETTFNTPADGERRAAQAEAIMRLWWGTESVEEIVFWSLWNKVAARNQLQHGVFDDTRNGTLTRHGEAIVSLMNDRWRTVETATTDAAGAVELHATLGDYVATWDTPDGPREVRFRVEKGPGVLRVAAVGGAPPSE